MPCFDAPASLHFNAGHTFYDELLRESLRFRDAGASKGRKFLDDDFISSLPVEEIACDKVEPDTRPVATTKVAYQTMPGLVAPVGGYARRGLL